METTMANIMVARVREINCHGHCHQSSINATKHYYCVPTILQIVVTHHTNKQYM